MGKYSIGEDIQKSLVKIGNMRKGGVLFYAVLDV